MDCLNVYSYLKSTKNVNVDRFGLAKKLKNELNISIDECLKNFGAIPRRVFGIGKNRNCVFSVADIDLYIQKALLKLEKEELDYSKLIDDIISSSPLKYTMITNEIKKYLIEDMELLPEHYTKEDLEDYIYENLPTDKQLLSELYNKSSEELDFLESACNKYDLDFDKALNSHY